MNAQNLKVTGFELRFNPLFGSTAGKLPLRRQRPCRPRPPRRTRTLQLLLCPHFYPSWPRLASGAADDVAMSRPEIDGLTLPVKAIARNCMCAPRHNAGFTKAFFAAGSRAWPAAAPPTLEGVTNRCIALCATRCAALRGVACACKLPVFALRSTVSPNSAPSAQCWSLCLSRSYRPSCL